MRKQFLTLAAFCGLSVVLAGCPKDPPPASSGSSAGEVVITANPTAIVANGTNFVDLTVTNTTGTDATLVLSPSGRGSLSATTVPGAGGTVTLTTCVAGVGACVGVATVTATAGTASDTVSVTFGDAATTCATNCNADAACSGLVCTAVANGRCSGTFPALTCIVPGGGVDPGTPSAIEVAPARTRLPPSGKTDVVVTVTGAAAGTPVALATTAGTLSAATGTTDADGMATFTLTMGATPAVATLTATSSSLAGETGTATVTVPRLGSISILTDTPVQFPVQGVKGSGWNEEGYVQVQVLDDQGLPYPDDLPVRFEHRQLGGSTFGGTLTADTATCVVASRCVGFQGATASAADPDSEGLALAMLQSGTVAGTLQIVASATVGTVTRTATLPTVAVVGAKANGANFSIVCGPRNVPALAETDCSVSMVEASFTCMAILKDRYNNVLGTSTQVIFASEAAAVGQVATTPAYDSTKDGLSQPDLGSAAQIFNTLGAGLPFDVPVQGSEPWVSHGLDGCGTRTHNPRDGVVTIVAVADGEEAFFDANGNGAYDAGEPYVDQGEPFLDANDNGQYDVGEWFLNVDGNADNPATPAVNEAYTARNGAWDANGKIWTQTVVVYTGLPEAELLAPPPATAGYLLGTRWSDNAAAGCTPTAPPPAVDFALTAADPSVERYVYASDLNLNMLHQETTYERKVELGSVKADYFGLASYADNLGFFYRYWPCDQAGSCASQCRATGANLPCVMTPALTSYTCGPVASILITGTAPTAAEPVALTFTPATPFTVYGDIAKDAINPVWLRGTDGP